MYFFKKIDQFWRKKEKRSYQDYTQDHIPPPFFLFLCFQSMQFQNLGVRGRGKRKVNKKEKGRERWGERSLKPGDMIVTQHHMDDVSTT